MVFYPGTQPFRCYFWPYFSANSKSGSPLQWVSMVAQSSELGMVSRHQIHIDIHGWMVGCQGWCLVSCVMLLDVLRSLENCNRFHFNFKWTTQKEKETDAIWQTLLVGWRLSNRMTSTRFVVCTWHQLESELAQPPSLTPSVSCDAGDGRVNLEASEKKLRNWRQTSQKFKIEPSESNERSAANDPLPWVVLSINDGSTREVDCLSVVLWSTVRWLWTWT